ncbi:MAG: beta-galactosidase [Oscillospiraceae bacterium]|nr:beta-galactosidase [Oscillospiraceae bacterium]
MIIDRPEHPDPQFMRRNWENLNGQWQFEIDHPNSGEEQGWFDPDKTFSQSIRVPFCPESKLSGIGYTDFMRSVWYKRDFTVIQSQLEGHVLLHFGAVDYEATVYINGTKCGTHRGGYVSFALDITPYVKAGTNILTVHARDDTRNKRIPTGKQSERFGSYGCFYTRTTGIWQTVWLEFVPKAYIRKVKYNTDIENGILQITAELEGSGVLRSVASYRGEAMGSASVASNGGIAYLSLPLKQIHLWEVGQGRLYDLKLSYGQDEVDSYFGMRSVQLDGYHFRINGKSVFQRLVLDQGFYPEGIYTAPSDRELLGDIERSLVMGFNGARLHEKVFEKRFLYHCDRIGYLVWGEYPNWGLDHSDPACIYNVLPEWLEELDRDRNHPSIVGWCPFNETWDTDGRKQYDELLSLVYRVTKAVDPTRPCIDTSGNFHVMTDIFDVHNYDQNPETFAACYDTLPDAITDRHEGRQKYRVGQPIFVSEYGGIAWSEDPSGWGYGNAPASREEFLERLKDLTDAILNNPCLFGFCYTQLTDVEQEQNGLYTYDRRAKFDPAVIAPIFSGKAAIEDE